MEDSYPVSVFVFPSVDKRNPIFSIFPCKSCLINFFLLLFLLQTFRAMYILHYSA